MIYYDVYDIYILFYVLLILKLNVILLVHLISDFYSSTINVGDFWLSFTLPTVKVRPVHH